MQNPQRITAQDWHNKAKSISISNADMNKLVMNFFIVEGYRDAAMAFSEEAQLKISDNEINEMTNRIQVKQSILNGDIERALKHFESCQNKKVLFTLKMQKLIEIIKLNKLTEAIEFAQQELTPFLEDQPHLIEEIEKAMSLLAFEDYSQSPLNYLVQGSQRIKVASEVNTFMLSQDCQGKEENAKIAVLMKLLKWAQKSLSRKLHYPELVEISTGKFAKDE